MTYRQRKARRRGRRGARRNPALLVVFVPLLIVGVALLSRGRLRDRDRGRHAAAVRAQAARQGRDLGRVRGRRLAARIRPLRRGPHAGAVERHAARDVREATVAIEDERFYEHEGVDFSAIIRAGVKNLESGDAVQGGSTITQQLVRALYIEDPERNFERKIREAKLAQELEDEHPGRAGKNWILREYLNSVPYGTNEGRTSIGIEAAGDHVLREARAQPRAARGGAARRPPAGAVAVQPVPEPDRGARAAQRGAAEDGRQRVHHRRARPRRRRRGRST